MTTNSKVLKDIKHPSQSRKRVLWLSHLVPYPPKGGVQQRSFNLLREISKYHDVDFLSYNQLAHISSEQALQEAIEALSKFCRVLKIHDIPSDRGKFGKQLLALKALILLKSYTVEWLNSKEFELSIKKLLIETEYDVVHFDTISLAPFIANFGDVLSVLNHHNIESDMLSRRASITPNKFFSWYLNIEARRLKRQERKYADRFSLHITCSDLDSDRLKNVCGHTVNTEVIPNGVDLDYFSPNPERQLIPFTFVFAGRMSWYPNAAAAKRLIREIWPEIRRWRSDAKLSIVGKNPPPELIEATNHDHSVTVTGYVDDVRPYLEAAHIYLCPIQDGGGTKLKILDALAMKCAVVADPIACEGIEVQDSKHVCFATEAKDYVLRCRELVERRDFRNQITSSGRQLIVEKYSFESIGEKYSLIISQLSNS